ncbi:MAG: hypothetical protein JXP34_27510 [Planctomycetes bacterium]|nr:hypothetical protein [Planctomycetota bacterium]
MQRGLAGKTIDVHCHVGLLGDTWPHLGRLSDGFRETLAYRVFLLYARIPSDRVTDPVLRDATVAALAETTVDHVVCLALDYSHDERGRPEPEKTAMYVSNEYILELRRLVGDKVLLGASVHPYAERFEDEVRKWVDEGAVLLKWLPSAQAIDLASERAGRALRALARLGPAGGALPLLLHTGAEYAVPPAGRDTPSLDFHSWSKADGFWNLFRRWRKPRTRRISANLRAAVEEGAVIIFAHCGLPYFEPGWIPGYFEHSDLDVVRAHLESNASLPPGAGRFLGDLSAFCTPFRRTYLAKVGELPAEDLLYGSDFPTPIFESSGGRAEAVRDFKAAIAGDPSRLIVPEGNLLDVSLREMEHLFGADHPMFTRFGRLWDSLTA